jgi:hypothetical protein
MPIPSNQINYVEIHVKGLVASGGSSSKFSDFVFHFRRTANVLPVTKLAVDTAFQAAIVVPIGALLNVRWTQQGNTIRWIDDALDAPVQINHAVAGAIAGDSMSTVLSSYMIMRTALRGRSYRGSKHLFPLSETDTTIGTDDLLNAAALVRYGTLATALATGFTDAAGNVWVSSVLSRTLSQLRTNPTTVVANDVITVSTNKRIGRMRRRHVASVY